MEIAEDSRRIFILSKFPIGSCCDCRLVEWRRRRQVAGKLNAISRRRQGRGGVVSAIVGVQSYRVVSRSWTLAIKAFGALLMRLVNIGLRDGYDYDLTAIWPRYDHSTTYVTIVGLTVCGLLNWGQNRSLWLRLAGYVTVTLMTSDKQSNGRRIEVES